MKNLRFLIIILFITTGCDRDPIQIISVSDLRGEYEGTFERNGRVAQVQLQFDNQQFTGSSSIQKFPAICKGNFKIKGNKIEFFNECPWTAEFDWSLILSGEWVYQHTGNMLILNASNGDKYTLTKK